MRSSQLVSFLAPVALLFPLIACGGGTPEPKNEDEAVAKNTDTDKDMAKDDSKDTAAAPADTEAPAASAAPEAAPAPAASSSPSSSSSGGGDTGLAIPKDSDDPFLAHHQMPAAQVKGTTGRARGKVQACYKAGLKRDKSTRGDVKIRFVVSNDGVVKAWRNEDSSMSDEQVTSCIGDVIKGLKFPKQKSPGDAYGIYSIHLAP
jgi:hypothetical protein